MNLEQIHTHDAVEDPVCGMTVDPAKAAGQVDYLGETYYFCNPSCVKKFKANPEQYLAPVQSTAPRSKQAEYTCPMHPEIVRSEPGACPICGMASSRARPRRTNRTPSSRT